MNTGRSAASISPISVMGSISTERPTAGIIPTIRAVKASSEQPTGAPAAENSVHSAKPDTTFTLEISRSAHIFRFKYTLAHVDGFNERSSLVPLNIHSDSEHSFRTDLGVRASYAWHVGSVLLLPSVTAAWEHEYSYSALPITVSSPLFPGQTETLFWSQRRSRQRRR